MRGGQPQESMEILRRSGGVLGLGYWFRFVQAAASWAGERCGSPTANATTLAWRVC